VIVLDSAKEHLIEGYAGDRPEWQLG